MLLLAASCSTYVPLEYDSFSEIAVPKGTAIKFKKTEQVYFEKNLAKAISDNGWWKIADENEKNFYEFSLKNINRDAKFSGESVNEKEGKKFRTVTFASEGNGEFDIKKNNEKAGRTVLFSAKSSASSEREMPKDPGANSLRPLVTLLTGYDERDEVKEAQNTNAHMLALDNLNPSMVEAIIKKIVPERKYVDLLIEEDEDDMEVVVKYIDKDEFDLAILYLTELLGKTPRSDVYYNLGVLQEYRQKYPESCVNYQKAYEQKPKKLYLEEKTNCLVRQAEFAKIAISK